MKLFKSKKLIAVAATVAIVAGATAAWALWTATGSGSGSAEAATAAAITVTATANPAANDDFYPGAPAVEVTGTGSNTNNYPVEFDGWENLAVDDVSGGLGTCSETDFTAGADGTFSSPLHIDAHDTAAVTIPAAVSMNSAAGDGCQGAMVTVTFDLTGGTQVAA
jgi:hypothetical protein